MSDEEILKQAFINACKYLQVNPPSECLTFDEVKACAGAGGYKEGWKQWANLFVEMVLQEKKIEECFPEYFRRLNERNT